MKLWLLLVSLLLSDPSPHGDGDWIMDYFRWPLCGKLRLKVPSKGLGIVQMACFHGDRKNKMMGSAFYLVSKTPKAQDQTLRDIIGAILRNPMSTLAKNNFHEEEKLVPVLRVVSETCHTTVNVIKTRTGSKSVWLHHHCMASGSGSLFEEPKSRLPVTAAHLRRCLTKRCSEAKVGLASCCPHDGKMKSATQEEAEPRVRAKELTADVKKRLNDYRQRPVISRHDNAQVKAREDLSSSESLQKQPSLKTSREEGFSVLKQLLLISRKNKGSNTRPQYEIRPDDEEYFSGKIITKESELRGNRVKSHMKTAKNEESKSTAYLIGSAKTDHDGVRLKSAPSEALTGIFLQETEMEIQTQNLESTNLHLMGLLDFPPMTDFITEPEKSGCRCSDGGESSAETEEGRKSADENVATVRAEELELSGTLDLSSVSKNDTEEEDSATFQLKMIETTTKALTAETTTTKIPETTTRDKGTTASAEVRTHAVTFTTDTTTTNLFSGLRMRGNIHTTLMEDTDEGKPPLDETMRRHNQNTEPSKPVEMTQKETTSVYLEAKSAPLPRCGGLIALTQAGWKHCMERLGIPVSRRFSLKEAPDVRRQKEAPSEGSDPLSDDGNDHFYYFDGVMKKVPANVDPVDPLRGDVRKQNRKHQFRETKD